MIRFFLILIAAVVQTMLSPFYKFKGRPTPYFEIINKNELEYFLFENEARTIYEKGFDLASMEGTDSLFKRTRLNSLYYWALAACSLSKTANIVELGCWRGHSSYMILQAMKEGESTGKLFIFDSFEGGLSSKTEEDFHLGDRPNQKSVSFEAKLFASTEVGLHDALRGFSNYLTFPGWIPDRFQEVADQEFCLIHIDVDLYEPIMQSLEFFYSRLVEGGMIVVDDYGYSQFPGAKRAVDDFLVNHPVTVFVPCTIGGCLIIK